MKYLVVGLGGFAGANARFWLSTIAARWFGPVFPYGTLIINVSGSFLIGLILSYLSEHSGLSDYYRLLLVTGFLGAYTTFSTYTFESLTLLREGSYLLGAADLFGSLLLGLLAVFCGFVAGRAI
jgi:CrcB protein